MCRVKKLINDPQAVVKETVEGFGWAHADIVRVSFAPDFVCRVGGAVAGKVGLVSGGGSGHEPLHAGFVGVGMLDAAVPGPVFTSPTPDQIAPAFAAANGGAGVLAIVKNYTGDVLNFETAVELAEADDIEVATVIVNDDVAVEDSLYTAGRRGVAGTVLVEKLAGAAAERGDDLAAVTAIAQRVITNVKSMGVALTACIVPHAGVPSFDTSHPVRPPAVKVVGALSFQFAKACRKLVSHTFARASGSRTARHTEGVARQSMNDSWTSASSSTARKSAAWSGEFFGSELLSHRKGNRAN